MGAPPLYSGLELRLGDRQILRRAPVGTASQRAADQLTYTVRDRPYMGPFLVTVAVMVSLGIPVAQARAIARAREFRG